MDLAVNAAIAVGLFMRIGSVMAAALYIACIAVELEATAVIAVEDDTTAFRAVGLAMMAAIAVWDAATAVMSA